MPEANLGYIPEPPFVLGSVNFHQQSFSDPLIAERLDKIEEKLDSIINTLKLIFGDSVLIDGKFKNLKFNGKNV